MNVSILSASLHDMVCKSPPRQLGDRSLLGPGCRCCPGQSSKRGQGWKTGRESALSRAKQPLFPLSLPAAVVDLDGAVATLDLDRNSGRGFYRLGGFVVAPSVLDRCW
jgi:hypothetical protein